MLVRRVVANRVLEVLRSPAGERVDVTLYLPD
jgi:hypothetical protein